MKTSIGLCGATGKTPELQIGQVKTVDYTQKAIVEITGTRENPVLNFNIPKGKDGAKLIIKETYLNDFIIVNSLQDIETATEEKTVISARGIDGLYSFLNSIINTNTNTLGVLKNDVSSLSQRMNAFTKLGEGTTTADAEIMDARTGLKGESFENLGGAIREQLKSVYNEISKIITSEPVNGYEEITGSFLRPQDGGIRTGYPDFKISNYISVQHGDEYTVGSGVVSCWGYDINKNPVINLFNDISKNKLIINNENVKYIVVCGEKTQNITVGTEMFNPKAFTFKDNSIPSNALGVNKDVIKNIGDNKANMVNNIRFVKGVFIRPQDGRETKVDNFNGSDYIEINGIDEIEVIQCNVALYDINKTFISHSEGGKITLAQNVAYIRFSYEENSNPKIYYYKKGVCTTKLNFNNVVFEKNSIPYYAISTISNNNANPTNIKTVGLDNCDYKTITQANAECDGSYSMFIYPNTYKESFKAYDNSFNEDNKRTPKRYIGFDKDLCVIEHYNSKYADDTFYPNGDVIMKNLTVKSLKEKGAETCAYALHIDNNWLTNATNKYENCTFYSEGRASVGIGTRPNCDIEFKNCEFTTDSEMNGSVFIHNSSDQTNQGENQKVTFINCTFKATTGYDIALQMVGGDNNNATITFINCVTMGENPITIDKSLYTGSKNGNIKINTINCNFNLN